MTPHHPIGMDRALDRKPATPRKISPNAQGGATLIELMVGITIGLLTITVALGALMVSRGVSGTVSDASQLQQQAAYGFRVFGQQLRQAGSLRLNLASQKQAAAAIDTADPVAFETKATDFDPTVNTLSGKDAPAASEFKLTTGYRNYTESLTSSATEASQFRNCLGLLDAAKPTLVQSQFALNTTTNELVCAGSDGTRQPILQNVADFQVRYLVQTDAVTGDPKIQYVNATTVGADWTRVFGIEVCLSLYGTEAIELPAGSSYKQCDGTDLDMTTLTGTRKNRMHMTFRSVYQLRSQGLAG
ncbi:hypothetical protein PMI14_00536 [Acidovorax sp. CF316]|nr:hypothetical protein PMI14_00536 [Acidovorax sp. CF316]